MKHVYVIAEAGVNHNGSIALAEQLIVAAAAAGADAVKFQTFVAEAGVSRFAEKAAYQKTTTGNEESQLEMVKKLELPFVAHEHLKQYAFEHGIQFLSTAFDAPSIRLIDSLDLPYIKVPSGEVTNLPFLRRINALHKPIIFSTGMSTLDEVSDALAVLKDCPVKCLLHCTTEYPCPFEGVNLNAMLTLRNRFSLPVGYSDHTTGIEVPVAAVAMGAEVIEKHFTLDRDMPGPDHKASLEPCELKSMIDAIRHVERALGDGVKVPADCERKNIAVARRSIVAMRPIAQGETFTEQNLGVKRPGTGISPMCWDEVIGRTAKRDFKEDELIEL